MLLFVLAHLGGIPSKILLDTGATVNLAGKAWWKKWEESKKHLSLVPPDCSVIGAHSNKPLSLLGMAKLSLAFSKTACVPLTFLISKDFNGEVLLSYSTLKLLGGTLEMAGKTTKVKFSLWPGQIFEEYIPSLAEIKILKHHEALVVQPLSIEFKRSWITEGLRNRILSTSPYTVAEKRIYELTSIQIQLLKTLIDTNRPILVIIAYTPRSIFYEILDSLVAPPLLISVGKETRVLGMIAGPDLARNWRKKIAVRRNVTSLLEEKLLSWSSSPTEQVINQARLIARHITHLIQSDMIENRWVGIAEDDEKSNDSVCYVPSTPVTGKVPHKRTPLDINEILAKMKFGKLSNERAKRDLAQGLFQAQEILQSHETAQVKNFEYRILLKNEEPINGRRRQSPEEVKF